VHFWSAGPNAYHYQVVWSVLAPGGSITSSTQSFSVSEGVSSYKGFVLIRPYTLWAASAAGPGQRTCAAITDMSPQQPTRAVFGWVNDAATSREEFAQHVASMTVMLVNETSGAEMALALTGVQRRWGAEPPPGYTLSWFAKDLCDLARR
jgi:hypothetical protein